MSFPLVIKFSWNNNKILAKFNLLEQKGMDPFQLPSPKHSLLEGPINVKLLFTHSYEAIPPSYLAVMLTVRLEVLVRIAQFPVINFK